MSEFFDPYNADRPLMLKCSCGRDHSPADHHAEVAADAAAVTLRARSETAEFEADSRRVHRSDLGQGLVSKIGRASKSFACGRQKTAMAAIASVLPVASLQAMAQKKDP
jgi:nitrate/nitrite transport system substrate-binding protein